MLCNYHTCGSEDIVIPQQVTLKNNISITSYDGEINAMVEGSEFKESHVLKILS
jgi:uncharacterized protein (UPF0179 family)